MIREANMLWQYQDLDTGLIMPWYTLPALEWLKKQDVSKWEVFEYGAGYSTIWWRYHCKDVISIDHDPVWSKAMNSIISKLKDEYIEFPHLMLETTDHEMGFDCIVVDGEHRIECVKFSRDYVAHGGYMIVDNYGQTDFPSADIIDALLEGWEKQIFRQPNHSDWCTAVFRKP